MIVPSARFELARSPVLPRLRAFPAPIARGKEITITVCNALGQGIPSALVVLLTELRPATGAEKLTDINGRATFVLPTDTAVIRRVVVDARSRYWSKVQDEVPVASTHVVLERLASQPGGRFDWGTARMDAAARGNFRGAGVKVAVVDSGIDRSPAALAMFNVARGANFVRGEPPDAWQDLDGHGTHCAGTIGGVARVAERWGLADRAELYIARVFAPGKAGQAVEIADAIRWAVDQGCHVINLSLSAGADHVSIRHAVEFAHSRGALCIAAAGNDSSDVSFPAAYDSVVAVSAVGGVGTYPADSMHSLAEPEGAADVYLAPFSNRGHKVEFCAPGVAVGSDLVGGSFGVWDGTSVACPHVAGAAALALELFPEILGKEGRPRADLLLATLRSACTDVGLPATAQGSGMLSISKLVGAAELVP